jgi:xanthine dehydrogenase YagT iron-sulfur-binding subunit
MDTRRIGVAEQLVGEQGAWSRVLRLAWWVRRLERQLEQFSSSPTLFNSAVGGRRINSCLTLAVMHEGDRITTIEGLGTPEKMHPMQAAFVKHDGYQCGYCTPGQICSAVAVLEEIKSGVPSHVSADLNALPQPTVAELRERMSGNICRCGAYSNIVEAINEVAGRKA